MHTFQGTYVYQVTLRESAHPRHMMSFHQSHVKSLVDKISEPLRKAVSKLGGLFPEVSELAWKVYLPFWLFGIFKFFRPSDPFLVRYLIFSRDYSENDVNNFFFPIWTYSYVFFLPIIGFIPSYFGIRNLIILNTIAQLISIVVLIVGSHKWIVVIAMVFYGLENALQTAFYTFPFQLFSSTKMQQKMTSYCYTSSMLGLFLGSMFGQAIYSMFHVVLPIFWVTVGFTILSTLIAVFLMPAENQPLTENGQENVELLADSQGPNEESKTLLESFQAQLSQLASLCRNKQALTWSIFYVIAYCGYYNAETYSTSLFFEIDNTHEYNGIVQSLAGLGAAIGSFFPALFVRSMAAAPMLITVVGSVICSALFLFLSESTTLLPGYVCFILYCFLGHVLLALITSRLTGDTPEPAPKDQNAVLETDALIGEEDCDEDESSTTADHMALMLCFNDAIASILFGLFQLAFSLGLPHGSVSLRFLLQGCASLAVSILIAALMACRRSNILPKDNNASLDV